MENEKLNITVSDKVQKIEILEGEYKHPFIDKPINVQSCTLQGVYEFLNKLDITEENILNSKVEFSYENQFIKLTYNQRKETTDVVVSELKLNENLKRFQINTGKSYINFELADFIKMNRFYFENRDIAMKLISDLRNFEAKVNKEIEMKDDKRANTRYLKSQVVESNLPSVFHLKVPVFVDSEPIRIEIEININSSDLSCVLISPDLQEIIQEESKKLIDFEIDKIRNLHFQLRIFHTN